MKITCDFCKTEYSLDRAPTSPVKCALCGHTWAVAAPSHRNTLLVFVAALCALLSAVVFAVVVVTRHQVAAAQNQPLVARVTDIHTVVDAAGVGHLVVSGTVTNQTDEIWGVPDLIVVSRDAAGNVVARQKFMPSATLLDAGGVAHFSHTLSSPSAGVKKITLELKDMTE
ncbi:MAG: FxLYD domain-containing protein [Alphaproteobacteria bacterium]|nr:FxLYD domain-containing protein [Alphaproteobacteria bacterium]MDE6571224.1 FxLYD domain-containing protein [Alphaproteobacteria bacterium]